MSKSYVFATSKPWNIEAFLQSRHEFSGSWSIVSTPDDLLVAAKTIQPRYIFFPHWSHMVPEAILSAHECVCFHMTDVPYGRGGSPLQNLILRGHTETKLTALRMTREVDAGPVYFKRSLSLEGSALEIFERASKLSIEMMLELVNSEPGAVEQKGDTVQFKRRQPHESRIEHSTDIEDLYNLIRMLDAPGYPHAFLEAGELRFEFTSAKRIDGSSLEAHVRVTERGARDDQ